MPGELRSQGPEGSLQGRPESTSYEFHSYLIFPPFKNEVVFQGLIQGSTQSMGAEQRWRDKPCPANKTTAACTHQTYSTYIGPSNPESSDTQPYSEMGNLQSSGKKPRCTTAAQVKRARVALEGAEA